MPRPPNMPENYYLCNLYKWLATYAGYLCGITFLFSDFDMINKTRTVKALLLLVSPFLLIGLLSSCDLFRRTSPSKGPDDRRYNDSVAKAEKLQKQLDSVLAVWGGGNTNSGIYRPADYPDRPVPTRTIDILHTQLDLAFDWQNRHVLGKANLTIKPYFHDINQFVLDAKSFQINEVALLLKDSSQQKLNFDYKADKLTVFLDKLYARTDTFLLHISYVAKPYERKSEGGTAVTDDKGIYFINHDGSQKDVPQQIWTQGETTANSGWFPTFDHPSEKMTEEIALTVEDRFLTVSNGRKVKTVDNGNGTHTDYWVQHQPHSVYLFALAIGEFGEFKDKWRDKEVNYYLEKKYAPYAKAIFGNTPEMMEFFSKLLGVDYPWDKYAQVVVREFVSGAMENTGCTIFFDQMNQDDRSLLDSDHEDIIAHELFHHWFGDLVTCESYAHLALNESFATYSEYLWIEHKYGKDAADSHLQADLDAYLNEADYKKAPIVRFRYDKDDDLFDNHSYQKGGLVLHLLRNYLGDEVFFEALNRYLTKYAYQNTEIHHLRMEFEAVSGEDLNWFFNQWFLSPGHPELEYTHELKNNQILLTVRQKQDSLLPAFRLHLNVQALDESGKSSFFPIVIDQRKQTFKFPFNGSLAHLVLDSEGILLGTLESSQALTIATAAAQYRACDNLRLRGEAVGFLAGAGTKEAESVLLEATQDKYWEIRQMAVASLDIAGSSRKPELMARCIALAKDEKAAVRAAALEQLTNEAAYGFKSDAVFSEKMRELLNKSIADRSYTAQYAAMRAANLWFPELADDFISKLQGDEDENTLYGAIYTLLKRSTLDGTNKAVALIERVKEDDIRFYATHNMMLEQYGSSKSTEEIRKAMREAWMKIAEQDKDRKVRLGCLDALFYNKDEKDVKDFFYRAHPSETDKEIIEIYEKVKQKL